MPTVLLAESNRDLRETCCQYLACQGFQVETAESGLDCVTKLRQFVPDLLILDLELPWGGGDGVLGMMREHARLASVPVLLTSAAASPQQLGGFVSPPVVKALAKPFPLAAFLEHAAHVASVLGELLSDGTDRLAVLVSDDEPHIREILRRQLEQNGFRVRTDAGREASQVLMVAGYGSEEDRRRSEQAGCEGHLVKSVPAENANDEIQQSGDTDVHRHSHDGGRP